MTRRGSGRAVRAGARAGRASRPSWPPRAAAWRCGARRSRRACSKRKRAMAQRAAGSARRLLAGLSRTDRFNVIAECKRRSPSRGVLRADYDPAAIAVRLRERRGRRDFRSDRTVVLRRLARSPVGRPPCRHRPDPPQGLRRRRLSGAGSGRGGRGRDAADRRGARRQDAAASAARGAKTLGLAVLVEAHTRGRS